MQENGCIIFTQDQEYADSLAVDRERMRSEARDNLPPKPSGEGLRLAIITPFGSRHSRMFALDANIIELQ